ncbi:MAG: hypothetical protein Gaeavirus15_6 [Gaeavirus sp.]|uniref:Uncharacterized protein n=1 Tax=Gaeavirus sp. TaxID=2487767 RepID=A0A3G4ZZ19_9VIRU|nr:MAG: hypothetical protein Gaeavirus15_6 [Gaeavirus sp.]
MSSDYLLSLNKSSSDIFVDSATGGGEDGFANSTNLIIAVVMIAVAVVIYYGRSHYVTVRAHISSFSCVGKLCRMNVEYGAPSGGDKYMKEFVLDSTYSKPHNNQVDVTFNIYKPHDVELGSSSYGMIMLTALVIAIFFIITWFLNSSFKPNFLSDLPSMNAYTKTGASSGLIIVTKKDIQE